jgi:hypothetical protein
MNILDEKFKAWTQDLNPLQARISIFNHVRDIPYAIVPSIMDYRGYTNIFKAGKGSCSPKHFLLREMYRRLGLPVFFVVYPHRWDEIAEIMGEYSDRLKSMALALPESRHLACKVEIEGRLVLVDATLDLPLLKGGFPVSADWDGFSDTRLPVIPCGEDEWYSPAEARLLKTRLNNQFIEFNNFLEQVRRLYNYLLVVE